MTVLGITSILAAAVAGCGSVMGYLGWLKLTRSQQWTAGFLLASVVAAAVGDTARSLGFTNAWVGNLWQLTLPGLLMPALISTMPLRQRAIYRGVQRIAVLLWFVWFFVLGHLFEFTTFFHAGSCIAVVLLSLTTMPDLCYTAKRLWRSPAFLLSVGAALACACDVLPHSVALTWVVKNNSTFMLMWIARNCMWAVGYAFMAYSLYLEVPDVR
jgi:hypothetical protein